jgi:hypothetical protein
MKKLNGIMIIGFLIAILVSCKKDEGAQTTPQLSDADRLAGIYNVTETEATTSHSKTYLAIVTRVNDTTISIADSNYTTPPNFHWKGSISVNLGKKYLKLWGTTVSGKITDEANWEISYLFGGGTVYNVKQVFTRKK